MGGGGGHSSCGVTIYNIWLSLIQKWLLHSNKEDSAVSLSLILCHAVDTASVKCVSSMYTAAIKHVQLARKED